METTGVDTMNGQFVYVFDAKDRDALLKAGFVMLKNDEDSSVFVFGVDESIGFDFSNMVYVTSDTLTF